MRPLGAPRTPSTATPAHFRSAELTATIDALGSVGWEVCGFACVDRLGFNGFAILLKRERAPLAPPPSHVADGGCGWAPDPLDRHQRRFWDGLRWTEHVSDNDVMSFDPPISR